MDEKDKNVMDVDLPFNADEVEKATSKLYAEHLTRSDIPSPMPRGYCSMGHRVCKKYEKGGMCKNECPIIARENKQNLVQFPPLVDDPIDVDMPFSYSAVASATSNRYASSVGRSYLPSIRDWKDYVEEEGAMRVLVVDDEVSVANSMSKIMVRKGLSVEEAFSAKEALAKVHGSEYDLVLLDVRLGDGDGMLVLSEIREKHPDLPVVMVTGYVSTDTVLEAGRRGATDFVAKPFTPDEIWAVAEKALKVA